MCGLNGGEMVNSLSVSLTSSLSLAPFSLSVCLYFCFVLTLLLTLSWSGLLKWGVHVVRALMELLPSDCFCQWHAERHSHTHRKHQTLIWNQLFFKPDSVRLLYSCVQMEWKILFLGGKKNPKLIFFMYMFIMWNQKKNACIIFIWIHEAFVVVHIKQA